MHMPGKIFSLAEVKPFGSKDCARKAIRGAALTEGSPKNKWFPQ